MTYQTPFFGISNRNVTEHQSIHNIILDNDPELERKILELMEDENFDPKDPKHLELVLRPIRRQ